MATLVAVIKAILGGGAVPRRGCRLMGDATLNFSGSLLSAGTVRRVIFLLGVCCASSLEYFLFAVAWANIFCRLDRAMRYSSSRRQFGFF